MEEKSSGGSSSLGELAVRGEHATRRLILLQTAWPVPRAQEYRPLLSIRSRTAGRIS
jgi:hypothetical protein